MISSVSKSMIPISTYVGGPDDGDDDPSDDDSDYDDDDHGDRGRRGRDHDEDEGSRRGIKRKRKQKASRGSGPVLGAPKMPGLDPKNYFWNGKTAFLRYYIEKWSKLLDPMNYSPASAVNFMLSWVPKDKQHLISDCTTLEEVLQELALHATDSTTHLLNIVEAMKSYKKCTTYKEDKIMLSFFEKGLSDITKLNSAYILNFLTAQQLCNKLSTITMRTDYIKMLRELKFDTSDNHRINNYLYTMREIIIKAKVEIENMMDIDQDDSNRDRQGNYASVYSTQFHGNNDGNRGKGRGGVHGDRTNGRPINQDERGDLLLDYDGNPIDVSKHPQAIYALQSSTVEFGEPASSDRGRGASRGNKEAQRGRGFEQTRGNDQGLQANRGAQRGNHQNSSRGFGRGQDSHHGSKRPYDHGQRSQRGSGRGSDHRQRGGRASKSDQYADKRYCVICKEKGHNNLMNCPKFPSYIPRGTNVLPVPKEVCNQCLSTAGQPTSCTHQYPADYKDWLCNVYKLNCCTM